MSGRSTPERPAARSRRGRFPAPTISLAIARTETRRQLRRVRNQDLWLALSLLGVLVLLVSLPLVFGLGRTFGEQLAAGDAGAVPLVRIGVAAAWVGMVAFGVVGGVGSEGEIDHPEAMLTIRPAKDVAGALALSLVLGYAPFVLLPGTAAAAGLSVGLGTPAPVVGILLAAAVLLVTGVLAGYGVGLAIKGAIRRSETLSRLKPLLGAAVVVGYFWLAGSGRLFAVLGTAGDALSSSPVGWLADLALLTTPDAGAAVVPAAGAVVLAAAFVPVAVLGVVRAAEAAWYVDRARESEEETEDADRGPTVGQRLDAALAAVGVRPATRGVTTTVLTRAYRSPLQLVYVAVPLLFGLPTFERMLAVGVVPEYAPWLVVLYGAWVAGATAPLNVLGNQGSTLPRLLTSPAGGRPVVHGYVLAALVATALPTAALAVAMGVAAGRSTADLVAVGLAAPLVVAAGAVLAAGVGALFPRFTSIDLTAESEAVLPSKTAFALFSMAVALSVTAVGALTDDLYRQVVSAMLAGRLPFGLTVGPDGLLTFAWVVAAGAVAAVPAAYVVAVRRIGDYRLD